jgi:hypothetical protein
LILLFRKSPLGQSEPNFRLSALTSVLLASVSVATYVALTQYAFYVMNSVDARITYITLSVVAVFLPLSPFFRRQERFVFLSFILMVMPWTLLYFDSTQNLVYSQNALPVYNWDVYLTGYGDTGHIVTYQTRGEYVGFHVVAYFLDVLGVNDYQALIITILSASFLFLFLLAFLYFKMLKKVSSLEISHILVSAFIILSISTNYLWIFSVHFFGAALLILFSFLFLKYGFDFGNKKLVIALLLLDIGISVTDIAATLLLLGFLSVYFVIKKNRSALLFSLPPIIYLFYYTSLNYLAAIEAEVNNALQTWINTVLGQTSVVQGLSIHPSGVPFSDLIGTVVFTVSFFIVVSVIALYQIRLIHRKDLRKTNGPFITFGIPFLLFYSVFLLFYFANRVTVLAQTDIGYISLLFAQMLLPMCLLPFCVWLNSLRSKKGVLLGFFLILTVLASMSNVYTWSYPKSTSDPISSTNDFDYRHQSQIYALYKIIHQYKVTDPSGLAYMFMIPDVARVVYIQRLSYIDNQRQISIVPYDRGELFNATLARAVKTPGIVLLELPNLPSFNELALSSDIVTSTQSEFLVIPLNYV